MRWRFMSGQDWLPRDTWYWFFIDRPGLRVASDNKGPPAHFMKLLRELLI